MTSATIRRTWWQLRFRTPMPRSSPLHGVVSTMRHVLEAGVVIGGYVRQEERTRGEVVAQRSPRPLGSPRGAGTPRRSVVGLVGLLLLQVSLTYALKPSLNAYFPTGFSDSAYQRRCLDKVLKSWFPEKSQPRSGKKTVVQSSIARDGTLIAAVVTLKSGSDPWDEAALAAVKKAAPFDTIPKSYSGSQAEVHWHFSAIP